MSLPNLGLLVTAGVLAVFWIAMSFLVPRLARRFSDVSPWTWLALAALLAVQAFVVKPLVPHTIYFANNHGFEVIANYRDLTIFLDTQTFAETYGNTFYATLGWLQLLPRQPDIFDVNFVLSQMSLAAMFLLVLSIFRSQPLALLSTCMLAWLPVRLRLSVSETMFMSAELYLILGLLLLYLFLRTDDFAYLVLGLVALFLLVESRVEFMLLAPLVVATFLLAVAPEKLGPAFRTPITWVTLIALAGLFVPRALVILGAMGQNKMFSMVPTHLLDTGPDWIGPFNVFFARAYTPLLYPVLLAVGSVAMWFRNRRMMVFLTVSWVAMTFVFSKYYFTPSCYWRRTIPVQFLLVILAAFGGWFLVQLLGRHPRWRIAAAALLVALVIVSVVGHRDFVQRLYTMQQEYAFMERAYAALPREAPVVYRAEEDDVATAAPDDPLRLLSRLYQAHFLERIRESDQMLSIRRFEADADRFIQEGAFAYLGAPCFKYLGTAPADPLVDVPGFVDPACERFRQTYRLEPVLEGRINPPSESFQSDRIHGKNRVIGLYRILERKEAP